MKLLIITNLFPNSKEPTRGVFNLQQFKALRDEGVAMEIIAPVPLHANPGLPLKEEIEGFSVHHPRYFMTPRIGRALYGKLFYLSINKYVRNIDAGFKSDAILSTWAYPDAVGSYYIARSLNKPFYVKVHGSDINMHGEYILRRKQIVRALNGSDKIIAVSKALKDKMMGYGIPEDKITVIQNGVDTELFKPMDKNACRAELGLPLDKKIILYAGNFVHVKGVDILVEAFARLESMRSDKSVSSLKSQVVSTQDTRLKTQDIRQNSVILVLVGDGPMEKLLRTRVKELGIEDNVVFAGRQGHDVIPKYMNACDVFCLPSRNEGCPNVVLEAMACGTPVISSNVGGVAEVLGNYGITFISEDLEGLMDSIKEVFGNPENHTEDSAISWFENANILKNAMFGKMLIGTH